MTISTQVTASFIKVSHVIELLFPEMKEVIPCPVMLHCPVEESHVLRFVILQTVYGLTLFGLKHTNCMLLTWQCLAEERLLDANFRSTYREFRRRSSGGESWESMLRSGPPSFAASEPLSTGKLLERNEQSSTITTGEMLLKICFHCAFYCS